MLDYDWGKEAFQRFPELIDRFDTVQSPYELWFELREAFEDAYKDPRNEDLISRIYDYANWCGLQPEGKTAETSVRRSMCEVAQALPRRSQRCA